MNLFWYFIDLNPHAKIKKKKKKQTNFTYKKKIGHENMNQKHTIF